MQNDVLDLPNQVLKNGSTVKALRDVRTETGLLYAGQYYPVKTLENGVLGVETLDGTVALTNPDGSLTEACDDVTFKR